MSTEGVNQVLRSEHHRKMTWANGAGVTWEVAREPENGDFDWRISFAEVDGPAPFSPLPGVDRVILLVDGDRLTLRIDGRTEVLPRLTPFSFAGEAVVVGEVSSPTVDLNVMTRRGRYVAGVEVRQMIAGEQLAGPACGLVFAAVLDGWATLCQDSIELRPRDVCRWVSGSLRGEGHVAVIAIQSSTDVAW